MSTIEKPHAHSDGAVARPDHVNENIDILYNVINGNLDWANIKAALQNAADGLVKLDGDALVPLAQIPVLTADKLPEVMPSGIIVMWSGTLATVPDGWSLCNGAGETPDLRDKFIYGWTDEVDPGGIGGATTHTHTYSNLPEHTHGVGSLATGSAGSHSHDIRVSGLEAGETCRPLWACKNNIGWKSGHLSTGPNHTHTMSGSTTSTGVASPETDAGANLPPYFKLAFIMKD